MVGIAQLARAPDCGSGGHRFESDYPPHKTQDLMMGYRQVGKAQDFDSCIRWFESSYPSHKIQYGPLAQSVEHLTFNQVVRRSNRRWLTRKNRLN